MKKIIPIILCCLICLQNLAFAEDSETLSDKMSNIWLSPDKDVDILDSIKRTNNDAKEKIIAQYLLTPGYARQKIGISTDDDTMKQQVEEAYIVNDHEIIKMHYLKNNVYAKQYADYDNLRYLISDDYYWIVKSGGNYRTYTSDGELYNLNAINNTAIGLNSVTDDGISFLKDQEKVSKLLRDISTSSIEDIKFLVLSSYCSGLYIDCGENEYLIRIYEGFYQEPENKAKIQDHKSNWAENLEMYKLYDAKEFFSIISENTNKMNILKPTYEEEAESLRSDGLLYGNEKGLDVLKPLTRAEAVTLLVRALGMETEALQYRVSSFSDISPDNWASPYASVARAKGIAYGVSDTEFAPNQSVTADQFATFTLRAAGERDFDYANGLEILIEKGIVTDKEAETMDLFTRGDMAKIIYEAKEKGLL